MGNNEKPDLTACKDSDPRDCYLYHWGYICFVTGLLQITVTPFITTTLLVFPENQYFIFPSIFLMLLGGILWFFSSETIDYQADIFAKSIIFYAFFQLIMLKTNANIFLYVMMVFSGLFFGLGTQGRFFKIYVGRYKSVFFILSLIMMMIILGYLGLNHHYV